MIQGAGYASLIAFLILGSQIGSVESSAVLFVYALLMIVLGSVSYALIQMPGLVANGEVKKILAFKNFEPTKMVQELENLCSVIRRDGLLASESARKELSDGFLRYLIKRVADGYERSHLVQAIRNQSMRTHEIASFFEAWIGDLSQAVGLSGLVTTLFLMMALIKSTDPNTNVAGAILPLLMGQLLQPLVASHYKNRFFAALDHARLYFVLLEEGVSGIQEGINADLLRDKLNCRLMESPKWVES
jgi:flagellar motor component MotA